MAARLPTGRLGPIRMPVATSHSETATPETAGGDTCDGQDPAVGAELEGVGTARVERVDELAGTDVPDPHEPAGSRRPRAGGRRG